MNRSHVYFIKPIGFPGPVKIGCSTMVTARRDSLACWSPFPLEILAEIIGDGRLERQFHARHEASHLRQEWFEPTALLLADIEAITAGTFDLACLPEPKRVTHNRRNNSYLTAEWRYNRSVWSRLDNLRHKMPYPQWLAVQKHFSATYRRGQSLLPHKATIEQILAEARAA